MRCRWVPRPAPLGTAGPAWPGPRTPQRRRSAMRARAMAMSVALLRPAGTRGGGGGAARGGRLADPPPARVASAPAGLDSLLPAEQLAPTGPAQWYMPWLTGGA